jgi:ferredoxin/DNA-binding Lrp family transcriptional regulator
MRQNIKLKKGRLKLPQGPEEPPEIYSELSAHFGHPESKILPKILERLVSHEEAELLLLLPASIKQVAEKSGIPVSKAAEILESLFKRGIVLPQTFENEEKGYALCGNLLDSTLFEIGYRKEQGTASPTDLELIDLWDELFEEELMKKSRPADNVPTARVIPVNKAITVETEILPFEAVSEIIKSARVIAVARCPCRTRGRHCENPLETCILLNEVAEIVIKRQIARKITTEEALSILEHCEDLGLVHHTDNASEGLSFICNCCPCCCFFLRGLLRYGKRNTTKSRYRSIIDKDLCTGCGVCETRCVFGAIKIENKIAQSDPQRCFGCGLCATKCPTNAISLIPVRGREHIPERTAQNLMPALPPYDMLLQNSKENPDA